MSVIVNADFFMKGVITTTFFIKVKNTHNNY